jgi:hypothetical protein
MYHFYQENISTSSLPSLFRVIAQSQLLLFVTFANSLVICPHKKEKGRSFDRPFWDFTLFPFRSIS